MSRAEVDDFCTCVFHGKISRRDMAARQIDDMDIITNARTIRCGIVVSKHMQISQFSGRNL